MVPAPYSAMAVVPFANAIGFAVAGDVMASRHELARKYRMRFMRTLRDRNGT
jgi:hypothetical protein